MNSLLQLLARYTTGDLCTFFKCTPEQLASQTRVGDDGLTRFERTVQAHNKAAFVAYGDTLYDQAWADNRVWDELERKANGLVVEMRDWSEAERQDELMEHYYEALERKGNPSRTKRERLRA